MKYDAENFLDDIFNIIKTNLNTKIGEIQTEKGNDYELPTINDAAYFDSMDEEAANYSPFVYYGIANFGVESDQGAVSNEIKVFVTVVLDNSHKDAKIYRKMVRYIRVLSDIIIENVHKIPVAGDLEIKGITPTSVIDLENMFNHKLAGIEISGTIA